MIRLAAIIFAVVAALLAGTFLTMFAWDSGYRAGNNAARKASQREALDMMFRIAS